MTAVAEPHRILLVTRNLPPMVGGMERLNWHLAAQLAGNAEVRVIGPAGSADGAPEGVVVREAPLQPLRRFLWTARRLARREATQWQPDIVMAGSGLTAPLARSAARKVNARAVVYVHGLDVATRHPAYRLLWHPALRRMHRVIANSQATADLCRDIGVDAARIDIVPPGVDLPESPQPAIPAAADTPVVGRGSAFRQRHGLGDGPLLLSVGRLTTRKGLREFVTHSLPAIVRAQPDSVFVVIGDAPAQALHARAQSVSSIQAAADAHGVGENIRFLGVITDPDKLADAYQSADVHVFPVREIPGDPEGFGMVAVEAAAHGLPTVAFATGGVTDAVGAGESGYLVSPGEYAQFADRTLDVLNAAGAWQAGCTAFARQFAWPCFGAAVRAALAAA